MQKQQYLQTLTRGWWIIALTALAALNLVLIYSYYAVPMYRTSARVVISPGPLLLASRENDIVSGMQALDRPTVAATYAEILGSDALFQQAGKSLQLTPAELIAYKRSAVVLPESNVLEITVEGPNPEIAANLANTVSQQAIDYITNLYQIFDVNLLDRATTPAAPFSPTPARDAAIATILGGMLGVILVVLHDQFREQVSVGSPVPQLKDSASSAYSRSYFLQRLEEELDRGQGEGLSVILVQFDGLRDLMPTMSSTAMQQLLHQIVKIIRGELRGSDTIARWDEISFAILQPMTSRVAATRTMTTIQRVLSHPLEVVEGGERVFLAPRTTVATSEEGTQVTRLMEQVEFQIQHAHRNGKEDNPAFEHATFRG